MAFTTLDSADLAVGKPTKKSLFDQIKTNQDDHETRISALASGANKVVVFEQNIDFADLGIGEIRAADMTTAEFQAIHGTEWILADGSSCSGSFYAGMTGHTVVPDTTNRALRGDGTDAATLSATQADQMISHNHSFSGTVPINQTHSSVGGTGSMFRSAESSSGTHSVSGSIGSAGAGSETRMKNVTVNFFIKINHNFNNILKARENMTIVGIQGYVIDNNGLPTAGTLEFDILKSSTTRSALTSIFTTKPTLAWSGGIADGDATSSGSLSGGGGSITSGDWLDLSVTSVMTKQTGIYIQIMAEPS